MASGGPEYGYTPETAIHHAELLGNRVKKTFRHSSGRFARDGVFAFCVYDWDIPEVRVKVDYYEGHLVVAEYAREQTRHLEGYLETLSRAAADAIGVPENRVHLRVRRTRPGGQTGARYERLAQKSERVEVRERDLTFLVDLDDYLDTGLFSDHRDTRALLRRDAAGKSFLNLYAYTGTFSVALAKSGARTTSVDLSENYLAWAKQNFSRNGLDPEGHGFLAMDVRDFLAEAKRRRETYDIVFVDPPSFSTRGGFQTGGGAFDVQEDHPQLILESLDLVRRGGFLVFSTNHQRFAPRLDSLGARTEEMTGRTIPEDYRKRSARLGPVHRTFLIEPG